MSISTRPPANMATSTTARTHTMTNGSYFDGNRNANKTVSTTLGNGSMASSTIWGAGRLGSLNGRDMFRKDEPPVSGTTSGSNNMLGALVRDSQPSGAPDQYGVRRGDPREQPGMLQRPVQNQASHQPSAQPATRPPYPPLSTVSQNNTRLGPHDYPSPMQVFVPSYHQPERHSASSTSTVSPISPMDTRTSGRPPPLARMESQPQSRHSHAQPSYAQQSYAVDNKRIDSFSTSRAAGHFGSQNADTLSNRMSQMTMYPNVHNFDLRKTPESNGRFASSYSSQLSSRPSTAHRSTHNDFDYDFDIPPPNDFSELDEASNAAGTFSQISSSDRAREQAVQLTHGTRHSFETGGISPGALGGRFVPRMQYEWSNAPENAFTKSTPVALDISSAVDPHYMQMLRNPYASAYSNPYLLSGSLQYGPNTPYCPMFQMTLPGLDGALISQVDLTAAEGVQSKKLYEFKLAGKSNRRYELKDIFDNIAEFAGDQHGSRFIQTKLETANSDEKERVFREIEPNAIPLMTDVFGNYVIQKFFDHGHQDHKRMLANKMRGQVLNLSTQMYGCRVVQKALEHVLIEQQTALVSELEHHVLECVKNKDGNHVIQKAIERCPPETIGFIYQAFVGQVQYLSLHAFGCRVIQRCLERQDWFPAKARIMAELHDSMGQGMVTNDYGNYVVQHVVEKGTPMDRKHVFSIVIQGLESYSKHKFASNVVEKCIEYSDDHWRRDVVGVLVAHDQRRGEGDSVLAGLIKDNYGNYVVQKLLEKLCAADFIYFHQHLQPAINHAKRSGCGKQLISIEKKMQDRLPYLQPRQQHPMMLQATPFASHYGSAANTPPPLTADTQSLQSSGLPSVNGDAVEGAHSMSRKGSEGMFAGR